MSVNIKSPTSYFFTDLSFIQGSSDKAFGPINNSENDFQITTTFGQALAAYAVTSGTLLFAQFDGSTDKVNILLKPAEDIGLGIKVKYFVYRGINASDLFKIINGVVHLNDTSTLEFLKPVWKTYTDSNGTNASFTADKIGYLSSASSNSSTELIKQFFTKNGGNLIYVDKGTQIGNFLGGFGGFEIVLDDGDFSQANSDTGLNFDLKFATANSCALKADNDHSANLNKFGGKKNSAFSSKIFRENVYKFMDPAAFYGSHVTDFTTETPNGPITNANGGKIKVKNLLGDCKSPEEIYSQIVSKFLNKNKTYLYIKSTAGRSYNFYKEYEPGISDIAFVSGHDQAVLNTKINFENNKWPLLIRSDSSKYSLSLQPNIKINNKDSKDNYAYLSIGYLGGKTIFKSGDLFTHATDEKYSVPLRITYPYENSTNKVISSVCYICQNRKSSVNNLFGPIDIASLFESTTDKGAYASHLRPIVLEEDGQTGLYYTKVVLESSNGTADKNLRTYINFPQASTNEGIYNSKLIKGGVYGNFDSTEKYCNEIYGGGEFWQGAIVNENNETINSLLYKKELDENELPVFHIGISEKNLTDLKAGIPSDGYNYFFYLDNEDKSNPSHLKYNLKIQYEIGTETTVNRVIHTTSVSVYTLDGYLFFTKDYSANFGYFKVFANATVEFRPYEFWHGDFGLDWYRRGKDTWPSNITPAKIFDNNFQDIVGTMPNQAGGNDTTNPFVPDFKMLTKLKRREYSVYPVKWTLNNTDSTDNERDCFASWLSLDKGKTASLNLKIRVKEKLSSFVIKYPTKYFKIGNNDPKEKDQSIYSFPPAQKLATNKARFFDLDITCKEVFTSTQVIQVWADNKLAGVLKAFPNANKANIDVLFIPVKIKLPDSSNTQVDYSVDGSVFFPFQKENLTRFFLQSQIKSDIEMFGNGNTIPTPANFEYLDLTGDSNITQNYIIKDTTYIIKAYNEHDESLFRPIARYLEDKLPAKYTSGKYKNYMKIFFLNIPGTTMVGTTNQTIGGGLQGYTDGFKTPVQIFKIDITNSSTVAHEAYHSLGIPHIFDKTQELSKYVYKPGKTDNIMDYSDPNPEESLYHWQWVIAKEKALSFF